MTAPAPQTTNPADEPQPHRSNLKRYAVIGTVFAAVAAVGTLVGAGELPAAPALHSLTEFVRSHGPLGVFCGVGIESIGLPVPGEATLEAVSAIAGHAGDLGKLPLIVGAAAAGGIVGDNIGYTIGRYLSEPVIRKFFSSPEKQKTLKVGRYMFRRYGGKVVFFGRYVAGLRVCAAFLAGANHMPRKEFFIANATGALTWATTFGVGGYFAADALKHLPKPVKYSLIGVTVAGAVVVGLVIKKKMKRLEGAAEEMFPGDLTSASDTSPEAKTDKATKVKTKRGIPQITAPKPVSTRSKDRGDLAA